MVLIPADFLWITVVSLFSIIGIGLGIYLSLPCQPPSIIGKLQVASRKLKRKSSCLQEKQNTTLVQCPQGCCLVIAEDGTLPRIENLEGGDKPVITGPQGHGFYTSGPWKIDTMGFDQANFGVNFSSPELIMNEYFASMINQSASPDTTDDAVIEDDPNSAQCHVMGNLVVCADSDGDSNDNLNDYALMDMSNSDADMAMMMF